jgi:amino acid adenylation domain-containing protein
VAVVYEEQQLTYGQLNARANRLAHYLMEQGVGVNQVVGLCMPRCPHAIIGLMGILKAGGAYMPLDPEYPSARLQHMLRDAAPRIVLAQHSTLACLGEFGGGKIAVLDQLWGKIAQESSLDLERGSIGLTPGHLACVIYTSGSSGNPKGVAAPHEGLVNRVTSQERIAAFVAQDVCCQKTSMSFADSVVEVLGPLSYGLPLVIATAEESLDPQALARLIEREQISWLISVPSLARSLAEIADASVGLRSVRHWTLSGEALSGELLGRLQRLLPQCRFINLYGSTEVAADVSCYVASECVEGALVPIGRPLPNTRMYLLDGRGHPVPVGTVGEIHVGGVALARGYLKRPQLTGERFLPNPFVGSGRMYQTGDFGRWRADGNLEYMGRKDTQVKVHGYRIELGEIEGQLLKHAQVKEAVVLAREDAPGEKRLVAYYSSLDHEVEQEGLRTHLQQHLPAYMVPAALVRLAKLPLTPSGKVDRRALRAPEESDYVRRDYEDPQGEIELALAQIWQELLGVSRVSRYDNFFELGGHSLRAIHLQLRIHAGFGITVPLRATFEHPTLHQLALVIDYLGTQVARTTTSGDASYSVEIF